MKYNEIRRKTEKIKVGNLYIGGDAQVSVQTMANVDACDYDKLYKQVMALEKASADLVRIAAPNYDAIKSIARLKESDIRVPICADIHFDYKLALECAAVGVDKIRINPGNIGSPDRVKAVADSCRNAGIPIRVGVNGGSLDREIYAKYGGICPEALAESALSNVRMLERYDFDSIVVAVKSSDVRMMIAANRIIASQCDYPIHIGVTEAGDEFDGAVRNSIGIGALLAEGIGDTIRVSLTANPLDEVKTGRAILRALNIDDTQKIRIVSCPTCGRTKIDIISLVKKLKEREDEIKTEKCIKVAVMGCIVNGPGEASDADIGIAGGVGEALLFMHGEKIRMIKEDEIIDTLINEINKF